jgi:phenylacetate-CoA ligase
LQPFDRFLRVALPHRAELGGENVPAVVRLRQRLIASMKRGYERLTQEFVSVWEVDRERLDLICRRAMAFRPDYILGYTSTLALLADYVLKQGCPILRSLRGVITIGETLTPLRRQLISDAFRVPIINRYGLREFGAWSGQNCAESPDTFHINTELVALEILDQDGNPVAPGESGRVVITDLFNRVMPFIRYDTGDLAVQGDGSQCACGRGFPRIGAIEGRSVESLVTPSGRTVSALVLGRYFREGGPLFQRSDHLSYMRHYQAIQQGTSRVRLLVVPDNGFNETRRQLLREDLSRLLGGEMAVVVETVEQIPLERSGKRPLVKHVQSAGSGVVVQSL